MTLVQYIGKKASKADNVARTGLTWTQGQVHPVTDEVAKKLLAYSTVWKEAPSEEVKAEAKAVLKTRPR
jgi:hypothetical protein